MEDQQVVAVHPQVRQEMFGKEKQPERPSAEIIRQAKSELKQMKKYAGLRLKGRKDKERWLGRRCKELMGVK
jgi:hypothetical protein